jgi:hypothetical protein
MSTTVIAAVLREGWSGKRNGKIIVSTKDMMGKTCVSVITAIVYQSGPPVDNSFASQEPYPTVPRQRTSTKKS